MSLPQVLRERLGSKLELSMHLNGDEAMAQGAAFYAANISTRFKVPPSFPPTPLFMVIVDENEY